MRGAEVHSTRAVMTRVLLALAPGSVALVWFFGAGVLFNLALCIAAASVAEAACLRLRGQNPWHTLRDNSAWVTACLLALALPPHVPWWLPLIAASSAIVIGKQVYGGLGQNLFNPAMVGYAVALISFPAQMVQWTAVDTWPSLSLLGASAPDALTMATPLDVLRLREGNTIEEIWTAEAGFGALSGHGWEWINLMFAAGGLWLVQQRIVHWHAPAAMLAVIGLGAALTWDGGSSASNGSPLFHWLAGGTMLGAFFIVTDPVSTTMDHRARWLFGAAVGVLVFIIRAYGGYPDGLAFAILTMNALAPLIDRGYLALDQRRRPA